MTKRGKKTLHLKNGSRSISSRQNTRIIYGHSKTQNGMFPNNVLDNMTRVGPIGSRVNSVSEAKQNLKHIKITPMIEMIPRSRH